ncbi:MAG: type II toxin-antitoxin system HicB family antitoxin [Thalassospira sp.]|uniref:type II toxin-antitoxin system HicB family antitoxin n=1 Tax=Thalassospira sp. 11-3 TaxID=2135614 RepID=UPI000D855689|nr:type II toxin-antitoxin system HicB family antitoxin [Thalassospira sp. 11-3]MBL4839942.1 type II toxin-antitoxin system HicB family antitoxin [Thalassospira sp.]PXX30885.1 putative RNase H-like HicB family nuclease [Thalassospira sp. 11-3]
MPATQKKVFNIVVDGIRSMNMERSYTAIIEKDNDQYIVSFPDLPGCMTFANSLEEAYQNARDLLPVYLEAMYENGKSIPEATGYEDVRNSVESGEDEDGEFIGKLLVSARMPGKMVRTNITLESYLLEAIDRLTTNRSAFFADLAEREIRKRSHPV